MQNRYYQITVAFLLLLLAVLFFFGYTPTNDGLGYMEFAEYCLSEHQPYPTTTIYQEAPFVWNIGIINLTELSLWLTHSITPVLIILCLMKSATALFVSLTAEKLFSRQVAILTLVFFVLYPNNWGQSTMISSEIPSTCLATLAVYLIVNRPTLRVFFWSGFLLALSNWFRPTAAIFIISIVCYLFLFYRKKTLTHTISLLLGFILFISIVGTSCYQRTDHFVYQARSYWFSMVDECYDKAEVAPHWGQPVWPEGTPRYIENHEQMDCFQLEQIWKQRSLDYLKDHKLAYLKKIPGRLYYMYQSDYDYMPAFLSNKSAAENNYITLPFRHLFSQLSSLNFAQWLSLLSMVCYIILLLLACINSIMLLRGREYRPIFLPLFIVVAGSLALVFVMHGETRFKDPLMPYIFILAASLKTKPANERENHLD